ncbi:hypothetical protein IQ260_13495 [Leptolyngbya cf. ectocarpi LEGE 11479]|uniref:Uncharacterized protein n=1 Tax=Leptolyngbya cf. ectocarpi LEGE 11479 TaxID=1828722 RepID=A0A929F5L6_LEPEC|nr:hypothetical protein [Leptolyngbya ectocarpi]MBE9067670.1 hypothetical protein [Leptolyngbya cf. ectocarpi LEGE 11479]
MVHGLLWLPLLIFFFWITWAGWNEYQKVETYKQWATQFERAKYDIYAALGQTERTLTWGRPTRQGITDLQSAQLDLVGSIELLVKGEGPMSQTVNHQTQKSEAIIQLNLEDGSTPQIPFTDTDLAKQWHGFLVKTLTSAEDQV